MSKDVSVIVPTYHRPALLLEAVESVLSQENVTVEVVVVDDSEDGLGAALVETLASRGVAYRKRAVSSGGNPAVVRQEAWPQTQGRYIAFLDDDDRVAPGGYQALVAALDAEPTAALAFGRTQPFGASGGQLAHELAYFIDAAHRARRAQWTRSRWYFVSELLFGASLYVSSAVLVRRESLKALGGLDVSTGIMDLTDLGVRACGRYRCHFVDQVVADYRFNESSLIHDPRRGELLLKSYERMQQSFRAEHGRLALVALKIFARTLKRWM